MLPKLFVFFTCNSDNLCCVVCRAEKSREIKHELSRDGKQDGGAPFEESTCLWSLFRE